MKKIKRVVTKKRLLQFFCGDVASISEVFETSREAIYLWPDGLIPEKRELQLRLLKPELFMETEN